VKQTNAIISIIMLLSWSCFSVCTMQDDMFTRIGRGVVYDATFSPDSKILAVSTSRGVFFHDPSDFTELAFIDFDEIPVGFTSGIQTHSICFSPDGKLLASTSINRPKTLILWDTTTHEKVGEIIPKTYSRTTLCSIKFSPDGKWIAFGGEDGTIRFLDIAERKEIDKFDAHDDFVYSICFSPDGRLLASISEDNTAKVWDLTTHKVIKTFRCNSTASNNNVIFSPDGKILAIGENRAIRLYDIKQKEERTISSGNLYSCPIDFSPDGKLIASGCVKFWNVDDPKEVTQPAIDYLPALTAVRFSPDGRFVICVGCSRIIIWDMIAQKEIKTIYEYVCGVDSVAISSDNRLLATGGDEFVKLWDIESNKLISRYKTIGMPWGSLVMSVSISPDSRLLAAGCLDGNAIIWDVNENKEFAIFDKALSWINTVAFSPDGKLLAAGGFGGIKLWDMQTEKEILLDGDPGYVWCIAFSPDGKYVASSNENKMVHIWDMKKLKIMNTLRQESIVYNLTFSPDGRFLGLGVPSEHPKVKLLDTFQFREISTYDGGLGRPYVAFNSNGCLLAIGSYLKVELWDLAKQTKLATFPRDVYVMDVCFSHDDRFLAIGTFDGVVLWDMQPYVEMCSGQSVKPDGKLPFSWGRMKSRLSQNYPNPFNPDTWIPYQLAEDSEAIISIYNTSGHLVRTLDLGNRKAGSYQVRWDGKDSKGQILASGVYFYVLKTADGFTNTKKMVLLK